MKKQMNVNENLLQLALKESQDTNIFKLSFNSNIIGKISQQSSIMTVTCNCSGKDMLKLYTKQVNTGKNENEIFEENVITKQITVLPDGLQECVEMFLKVIFKAHCR